MRTRSDGCNTVFGSARLSVVVRACLRACVCACRWASAGAFYPFSRNHYTYFARPHEYYRWPDVAESAKKAYGLRYRLLTYIYSNLYLAHTRGGPVAKPLLFTDPADVKARCVQEAA